MKIGGIAFTNTQPFFEGWDFDRWPVLWGSPADLSRAIREKKIMAAPLPVTVGWDLENELEPLGQWGIAVQGAVRSVFLLSRKPFRNLGGVRVGLTLESRASIQLLRILMERKNGLTAEYRLGLSDDDDAWLVIGDQALKFWNTPSSRWPVVTDLAQEWWNWTNKPFVFARWVVQKDLNPETRFKLEQQIELSLAEGLNRIPEISKKQAALLGLPSEKIEIYLKAFRYVLGPEELSSLTLFRQYLRKLRPYLDQQLVTR